MRKEEFEWKEIIIIGRYLELGNAKKGEDLLDDSAILVTNLSILTTNYLSSIV